MTAPLLMVNRRHFQNANEWKSNNTGELQCFLKHLGLPFAAAGLAESLLQVDFVGTQIGSDA